MGGQPVAIGPWTGGLNLREEPHLMQDNELRQCLNMDIGRAGELTSRVGLKILRVTNPGDGSTKPVKLLGSAVKPDGTSRLYAKYESSPGVFTIVYTDDPENALNNWTAVTLSAGDAQTMFTARYDPVNLSFAWFIPYGSGAVAVVNALEGVFADTSVTGIPRGSGAIVFKSRLFVYGAMDSSQKGTYRIYYSAVGNYTSFPVNNFFDVNPGDGDHVMHLIVQGDALVIFKRNSTWSLFFENDPFLGTLRKINNEIGAANKDSVLAYENELYVISRQSVYRVASLLFEDVGQNLNIPKLRVFHRGNDFVTSIGSKIICCIDTGAELNRYRYFVYHTEVGAWSEYKFPFSVTKFVHYLDFSQSLHQFVTREDSPNLYHMHPVATNKDNYGDHPNDATNYVIETKRYNYDSLTSYKRLFWWAVEAVTSTNMALSMRTFTELNNGTVAEVQSAKHGFDLGVEVYKTYAPSRFRLITYIMESTSVRGFFSVRAGTAMLTLKRDVRDGYPVQT